MHASFYSVLQVARFQLLHMIFGNEIFRTDWKFFLLELYKEKCSTLEEKFIFVKPQFSISHIYRYLHRPDPLPPFVAFVSDIFHFRSHLAFLILEENL